MTFSSIQLNPTQSNSIQLNPTQSNSIQLNPSRSIQIHPNPSRSIQIHPDPFKSIQIRKFPGISSSIRQIQVQSKDTGLESSIIQLERRLNLYANLKKNKQPIMPSSRLTADEAVSKLVKFSTLTHHRTYLKDSEQKRVDEAFQLLTNGRPPASSKGAKQKTAYLEIQRNIRKKFGDTGVVLCAAGLGPSAIAHMREEERVFLPSKLGEKWEEVKIDVFGSVADSVTRDTSLTAVHGDVYELSMEDVQKIAAMPGQINGIIRLTDPYNRYQSSFVTIPLSKELTDSLIVNRERIVE